jgi:hypothetical protein
VHRILREDMPFLAQSLVVRYEDLSERPAQELARLEQFLDLPQPFDRTVLGRNFRSHNIDGTPRPLQNLNARSLKRLTRSDLDVINRHAGDEARRFGYELL